MTSIVRTSDDRVMVGSFASGYSDSTPQLSLDQEVRREGLEPVVFRLWRQGRDAEADVLIDRYER